MREILESAAETERRVRKPLKFETRQLAQRNFLSSEVRHTSSIIPGYEERSSILQDLGDTTFKLVRDRATPDQWAEWLRAPLEHAAATGNRDLVDKLLGAGANGGAGWRGCHGKTLLHAAAEGGNVQVITRLRNAGAGEDMKAKALDTGHTPLDLAVIGGKEAAAKALIMAGANVNMLDATNDGPLHLAITGGHVGIAKDLLLSGANPVQAGSNDNFAIHLAACYGLDEVVLALVQKGVDLNCVNTRGEIPLCVALRGDHVATIKVLALTPTSDIFCTSQRARTNRPPSERCSKPEPISKVGVGSNQPHSMPQHTLAHAQPR
ncbi:F-box domain and ankyrin repeat protein [Ectocarpus siliculosus]|uniref:F-box domain and ankyrin repeat protein n=1 Tax=Ectocarpus siliculosus TaxID=2880 RepID=D8LHQ7_ECTSI|nr:F-box domain and ankyrin repeat protein [Ectocarpus siliculosus]|eukprot:CBN79339.1 F-box domain and ankyrin repeat protein [Ectocarpus siliculosus]